MTALAVTLGPVALIGSTAGSAVADSRAALPVTSSGDIIVDGVHQRVFISDPSGGKVVATDYDGTVIGTITSLPQADGLELSADSATVYVAVPGADEIVAIDTATLTEAGRYATGDGTDPQHLALAGGRLWFGYGSVGHGNIGSLDLSGGQPQVSLAQEAEGTWKDAPLLDSAPGAPDTLAAGSRQYYFALGIYDVSSGTADRTAFLGGQDAAIANTAEDLALTPDGTELVVATAAGDFQPVFRTSDLSQTTRYPSGYSAQRSVDVAPDGLVAVGTDTYANFTPQVSVYEPGGTTPRRTADFTDEQGGVSQETLLDRGDLAFAPDSSRLFAVTHGLSGKYSLRVVTDPGKAVTAVTVNAPATADRARSLTVSGKVTNTLGLPAGTTVAVTRTDLESPNGTALPAATVKADGTFSFTDVPPAGSKVTYQVSYAGDADRTAASASGTVEVSRNTTALTVNKNGTVHDYASNVTFTAHLGTTYKNRTLSLYADTAGDGKGKYLVRTGTVNSGGNLSVTLPLKRDTTVSASFSGDARTAPKTATSRVGAKVKVSLSPSRHYRTAKVNGYTTYYFRKKTNPLLTTTMTAYPGRAQKLEFQIHSAGAWRPAGYEYFRLDSKGRSVVELRGTHQTGHSMRVRSSYIDNSSNDTVNSTTHGSWKYFTFTS
ncbi:YncE family protein [Streptomyces fuscichromogenes]|uniref:YncE family protein n=1 Tax=Streptomyces fuscichromogenes TaxID=1324013 RepID=UPI0027E3BF80|nr:Ig-like domain repeat protein [Streptomyces fuscichromogenes]